MTICPASQTTRIADLSVYRLRLPLKRVHSLAGSRVETQETVLVRLRDAEGRSGWGEAATMPGYSAENVDTIALVLSRTFAEGVRGAAFMGGEGLRQRLDRLLRGNPIAKAALCLAFDDLVARRAGVALSRLWGERHRTHLPVTWVLGSGDADQEGTEIEALHEAGKFRSFMLKFGRVSPEEDIARFRTVAARHAGRDIELRVDINQRWDLPTARRFIPQLAEAGCRIVEQPLRGSDVAGMAELARRESVLLVADEPVETPQDMLRHVVERACHGVSVKIAKHGSAGAAATVAHLAQAAGLHIFAGTMFESSVGVASHAQFFATLPEVTLGSQFFGPLLMHEEVVSSPIRYENFGLIIPQGPGSGIEIDPDRLREFGTPVR